MTYLCEIGIHSQSRREWIDISGKVEKAAAVSGIREGICVVFIPHTTAAVTINENADPDVPRDVGLALDHISPDRPEFRHGEGNSDAHAKATLVGPSITLIISSGRPLLGTWQGVWFCEFDGPRTRRVFVRIQGE